MSTATPTLTARQLVESLPKPFRAAVLAELLREQTAAPMPEGFPVLTPERIAELQRRAADPPDKFISFEAMMEWIRTADFGGDPEPQRELVDATSHSSSP